MEAKKAEKQKVTTVLRSLIISNPGGGRTLKDLNADYVENVGKPIPKFEYRSVEDFLRSTGEFLFESTRGIVYAKPDPSSYHLAKLVDEQRNSKKKLISSRFIKSTPRLLHSRTSNGRTPLPKVVPTKPLALTSTMAFSFAELKQQANNNRTQMNISSQNTTLKDNSSSQQSQQSQTKANDRYDLRNRLNEKRQIKEIIDLTGDDSINSSPSVMTPPPHVLPTIASRQRQEIQDKGKTPTSTATDSARPLLANNPFYDASQTIVHSQEEPTQDVLTTTANYAVSVADKKKKSVNDRLVQARLTLAVDPTKAASINPNDTVASPIESPFIKSQEPFQTKISPTSPNLHSYQLENYCKKKNFNSPIFKTFHANNRYQCHVTIDSKRYSTYPTDYISESEAIIETAKYAVECLIQMESQKKYEMCNDSEEDLMKKIYDCIKDSPTGVLSRNIPDRFRTAYRQSLPSNWMNSLAKYPNGFTIEDSVDDKIVFVVESAEWGKDFADQKMEKLQLPWDEEYWCLFISHTASTDQIYGRLIGPENSTALDALITDIELDLIKNKQVADVFNVGQLYLTTSYECSYRVRVEKVDEAGRKCFCYFVDEGDRKWLDMDDLCICHKKFMKFPAQAIRFSLYGLKDYNENEFALRHLEDTLLSRAPFVGQVFTKKDDFISQEQSGNSEPVIEVVLYDTSTDEDINLNPIIEEKICSELPYPKLLPKLTPVFVSHIADNGDIFCQLQENGLNYINKVIRKFTPPNINNRAVSVRQSKLFLIYDEGKKTWCRAKLVSESKHGNGMLLVDYGNTRILPLSALYSLDTVSKELSILPPQAIQIKLSGFDNLTTNLVSILRGYFSDGAKAYVDVNKESVPGIVPEARLYFIKDDCVFRVNDCIQSEVERLQSGGGSLIRQGSSGDNTRVSEELANFDNLTLSNRQNEFVGGLLPKFQPPKVNDYFDIIVLFAATPSNFKVRPLALMPKWIQLMKSLQDYCNNHRDTIQPHTIKKGEAYACLYTDGSWQRAIIIEKYSHSKFCAFFCDSGDMDEVDIGEVKLLPEQFFGIPKLGVTVKLSGIKPMNVDWEMHDITEFNRRVTGKKFQAIVDRILEDSSNPHNNAVLEIRLIDVSTDEDVCINDEFVKEGRAIYSR